EAGFVESETAFHALEQVGALGPLCSLGPRRALGTDVGALVGEVGLRGERRGHEGIVERLLLFAELEAFGETVVAAFHALGRPRGAAELEHLEAAIAPGTELEHAV